MPSALATALATAAGVATSSIVDVIEEASCRWMQQQQQRTNHALPAFCVALQQQQQQQLVIQDRNELELARSTRSGCAFRASFGSLDGDVRVRSWGYREFATASKRARS
jgi:hypothetical protein